MKAKEIVGDWNSGTACRKLHTIRLICTGVLIVSSLCLPCGTPTIIHVMTIENSSIPISIKINIKKN